MVIDLPRVVHPVDIAPALHPGITRIDIAPALLQGIVAVVPIALHQGIADIADIAMRLHPSK